LNLQPILLNLIKQDKIAWAFFKKKLK